jgi:predicted anti-sigma-YlaC factor YlaD
MPESCRDQLDEELISGYLDNELSQGFAQKVRIHLEDCSDCRDLYNGLKELREVSMTTRFAEPTDKQWDERPQSMTSAGTRWLGLTMLISWLVVVIGFGLWQLWQAPQSVMERVSIFGGLSAVALLFISVLIDRIKSARNDPYRGVQR